MIIFLFVLFLIFIFYLMALKAEKKLSKDCAEKLKSLNTGLEKVNQGLNPVKTKFEIIEISQRMLKDFQLSIYRENLHIELLFKRIESHIKIQSIYNYNKKDRNDIREVSGIKLPNSFLETLEKYSKFTFVLQFEKPHFNYNLLNNCDDTTKAYIKNKVAIEYSNRLRNLMLLKTEFEKIQNVECKELFIDTLKKNNGYYLLDEIFK